MAKYIKCHKLNKYFKFIILTSFFRVLNDFILGYNYNQSFKPASLLNYLNLFPNFKIKPNISYSRIIEFFFNYIGTLFFSFFGRIYELKITGQNASHLFEFSDFFAQTQIKIGQLTKENNKKEGEIDENILYKFKNYLLKNTSIVFYFIFSFVWVLNEIAMSVLFNQLQDLDFWFFEILIVTFIYSRIFLVQIYKHQKFAIIINLIPTILKIACIILNFRSKEKEIGTNIYLQHNWWIGVGFLINSFLTAIDSFINCSLKSFLDLKYITINQLLMFYSSVGILISFLIGVICTFIPCYKNENPDIFFYKNCQLKYKNDIYFENFNLYFKTFFEEKMLLKN